MKSTIKIHPKDEEDDSMSDESSDLENELGVEHKVTKKHEKFKGKPNTLASRRAELKETIINGIMEEVLPDIGAYNIDEAPKKVETIQRSDFWNSIIRTLKYLGLYKLTFHEALVTGMYPLIRQKVREITQGSKPNPEILNQYNEEGFSPISIAVKLKKKDIVSLLLENGALPDLPDEDTLKSPLMHSIMNKTHKISKLLIRAGANTNHCDLNCVTPLMYACGINDEKHCSMLLRNDASVSTFDNNGWTPLHYASNANSPGCCVMLINEGVDRNVRDANRRKPLHIARFHGYGEVVAVLEDLKSKLAYAVGEDD